MTTKNPGPLYPNLKPWKLEPQYSLNVAAMTSEGLHDKSAIAEQLAYRDQQIADLRCQLAAMDGLRRIVKRTLASGQLEKLESARQYLADNTVCKTDPVAL